MRSRSSFGVSPKIVAAVKPRARIASATWVACSTPAQKASQLRPVGPEPHHLVDRCLGDLGQVDRRLQLAGDELAAAAADARHVELGLGRLADQRAEVAVVDQLPHRDLVGDVGEERALALVQHAAVEPVGRGGEADHLQLRVDAA